MYMMHMMQVLYMMYMMQVLYMMYMMQVLYMMSYAVTDSVGTQLWLDRTCRVNLNYTGDR